MTKRECFHNFRYSKTFYAHDIVRVRIWDLSSGVGPPVVLPVKAVSCLDHYPQDQIIVTGAHDVGRIQIWKRKKQWEVLHTLSGHLHGIRAVA